MKQAGLDQPLAVFEHEFAIGVQFTLAANVPAGDLVLPAHLRYQACDAQSVLSRRRRPTCSGRFTSIRPPLRQALRADPAFAHIAFGHGEPPPTPSAAPSVTEGVAAATGARGAFAARWFYELGTSGGYIGRDEFLKFVHNAEQGVKERGMFEGRGPLAILLIVLVGGFALNLTPCVLPMIPINLAIIGAGAQAGSRARGFWLGSAYGGAMAIVYGVLGLIVILTAGTFGTINASPWFNLGIAVLFVVLGLAMFDVLFIDFSGLSSGIRTSDANRGTFLVAFSMGAVAALLAGACVAPVVIQVVLFSSNLYATGTTLALALPFCLGIGMALPWPVAGAGLASLPKPGMWMVRVKQAFGILILVTAAYYGYVAYDLFSSRWVDPTRGDIERAGTAERGLDAIARRRPRAGEARAEAGADRHVGHLVQELSDDGQDDARQRGRESGARRLREDQVSGGAARHLPGERRDEALRRRRSPHVRHSQTVGGPMSVAAGRSRVATNTALSPRTSHSPRGRVCRCSSAAATRSTPPSPTNAVMGLVEPQSNGIGGDLFAIVYDAKTGQLHGLNASGWAPSGLTPAFMQEHGFQEMPGDGIHTVTVPGAVIGWEALRTRLGTMPMSELLAPAIWYADEGFPVSDVIAAHWASLADRLAAAPNAAQHVSSRRPPAGRRRAVQESRPRPLAAAHRICRTRRVLRRRNRGRDPCGLARHGRHADRGRFAASCSPSGSIRFRRPITAGLCTSCRRTRRGSRRCRCSI